MLVARSYFTLHFYRYSSPYMTDVSYNPVSDPTDHWCWIFLTFFFKKTVGLICLCAEVKPDINRRRIVSAVLSITIALPGSRWNGSYVPQPILSPPSQLQPPPSPVVGDGSANLPTSHNWVDAHSHLQPPFHATRRRSSGGGTGCRLQLNY